MRWKKADNHIHIIVRSLILLALGLVLLAFLMRSAAH